MRISCPYCGERGLEEFTYRGDASLIRPEAQDTSQEERWINYVYLRTNRAGPHLEYWYHGACHSWLIVQRDVRTHEIRDVKLAVNTVSTAPEKAHS